MFYKIYILQFEYYNKLQNMFEGLSTAIISPFKDKELDLNSYKKLLDYQVSNGVKNIVVCGTTGEASTMTKDEKITAIKCAVEIAKENASSKKVPIIVGTGSNNTITALEMSILAENLGADGLLVVTPYYNKTTQNRLNRIL